MPKSLLTALLLLFLTNIIFGQEIRKPHVQTTSATEKKIATATEFPDLVGLTGQKAPDFKAASMDGTEYQLENMRGKIVVVNLWATFCAPCITEMPKLNSLTEKFKNQNVVFLAPAVDDKALLKGFLEKHEFKFQVLPGSFGIVREYAPKKKASLPADKPGSFVMLLPTHLVIDREGTVVKHFWGFKETTVDELSQTIEQLLAKNPQ
jgi:peroxiredoxin